MTYKARYLFLLLVILLILFPACATPTPEVVEKAVEVVVTATPEPKALIPFGVQQSWKNDCQSAPVHVAIMAGYYEKEGLDVHLVEGGPGVNGVLNTLSGRENIYVGIEAGESNLIPQRAAGMPLVIIGALMQKKPEAFITLAKNIPEGAELSPALMKGQKIGVGGGENFKLQALLGIAGLTLEDVELVRLDVSSVTAITTGLVDWVNGWIINQAFDIQSEGFEWEALLLADWGNPMHGNLIYTTRERIEKEPELLAAFVRATLKGARRVLDDPEYALQACLELGGGYDTPAKGAFIIAGMNALVTSPATEEHGSGWVSKDKIMEVSVFLNEYAGIPVIKDIDSFVDMRFIVAANK